MSLFLLLNVGALAAPVLAQFTPITQIKDIPSANRALPGKLTPFGNLFTDTSVLRLNTDWNTNPLKASDLTFVLDNARFQSTNASQTEDHWDKIADQDGSENLFVLRFCNVGPTGLPDESTCALTAWPYSRDVNDSDGFDAAGFTPAERTIVDQMLNKAEGADLSTPPEVIQSIKDKLATLKTKKIHHYDAFIEKAKQVDIPFQDRYFLNRGVEIDAFSMEHKPSSTSRLSQKTLTAGQKYQADLWYCAAAEDGLNEVSNGLAANEAELQKYIDTGTDRLRIFKDECDSRHLAYFRLAGFQFTAPKNADEIAAINAQNQGANTASNTGYLESSDSVLPTCSWFLGISGSFVGCIAKLVYYLIYRPIAWIASVFGQLFDFFLGYSISDEAYRMGFAVDGWKLIRDISNIFFIIILIWTGFAAVFDIGNLSMKKVVPTLIVNALIINFSLFATRVVIDISNVVARVFYNTMKVENTEGKAITVGGYKSMSVLLMSAFEPQNIFKTDRIRSGATNEEYCPEEDACASSQQGGTLSAGGVDNSIRAASTKTRGSTDYAGFFIIVSILAAMIMVSVAKMFWKVAFFFLGRTIGLYVSMIFSPFAFLTRGNVPLVGNIKELKWSDWAADLTKYATLAPIFILFLYVVVLFANSKFTIGLTGTTFLETVVVIAVPMLIIYMLMKYAVSIAESYAGRFGVMIQQTVDKATGGFGGVVGGTIGVAAGAGAILGRNTVGRAIKRYGNSGVRTIRDKDGKEIQQTRAMRWAENADKSGTARFLNNVTNKAQTGSWDIRNAGIKIGSKEYTAGGTIDKTFERLGEKIKDSMSGAVGLGRDKALGKGDKPGGIMKLDEERAKKRAKELADRIKYDHLSDDQAKQVWENQKQKKIEAYGQENWEENLGKGSEIETLNKAYEDAKKAHQDKQTAGAPASEIMSAKIAMDSAQRTLDTAKQSKDVAVKAAEEAERKRLEGYGNVKNKADLERAMRGEYGENLKKQSQWLLGGKQLGLGLLGLSLGNILGTVVATTMLSSVAERLGLAVGGIESKAIEKMIKDAKRSRGKVDTETQFGDKLDDIKSKITDAVNKHFNTTHKGYDDFDSDTANDAISLEIEELENEIAKNKAKEQQLKTDPSKQKEYKEERLKRAKNERMRDEFKKAMENVEKWQDKVSKAKSDREKKEADSNKPK